MFDTAAMLKAFAKYRGDAIVVSGRGGKHWILRASRGAAYREPRRDQKRIPGARA